MFVRMMGLMHMSCDPSVAVPDKHKLNLQPLKNGWYRSVYWPWRDLLPLASTLQNYINGTVSYLLIYEHEGKARPFDAGCDLQLCFVRHLRVFISEISTVQKFWFFYQILGFGGSNCWDDRVQRV